MLNSKDILETILMIQDENLDVRTITMGISLLDCCDSDIDVVCERVYEKITRCAKDLVKTGEAIEKEMGIPIVNKRISITPAAMILAGCKDRDAVKLALALERAAVACGVNFLGGFSPADGKMIGLAVTGRGCQLGGIQDLVQLFLLHRTVGVIAAAGLPRFGDFQKVHVLPP